MQVNNIWFEKIAGLFLLLFCILVAGCKKQSLSPVEYAKWVKDESNGLHKTKELGKYRFEIQYKPSTYIILNERRGNMQDKAATEKRMNELDSLQYFDLRISLKNGGDFLKEDVADKEEFFRKQYYYSFNFQKDLKIKEGEDTYDCALFHFERDYDLSDARTFVLGFKKDKADEIKDKLLIIDTGDLGLGVIKIKIDKDDIKSIPDLQI
jgi:hypothetical protein